MNLSWLVYLFLFAGPFATGQKQVEPGITILVNDFDGAPVRETDLEVVDQTGRVVLKGKVKDGRYETKDLGFGRHRIVIGRGECGDVAIQNVYFSMDAHMTFRVVKNWCPHSGDYEGSGCQIVFRVRDKADNAVSGATATRIDTRSTVIADSYGRATTFMGAGKRATFRLTSGQLTQDTVVACPDFARIERTVVLGTP